MQQVNKPYKGLFITIEGGDGAGKSTLCGRLAIALEKQGYVVEKSREPGGSTLSEHIRDLLLDPERKFHICERAELLLFLAARAQHVEERILPALRAGKIVICERFNDSTIAYQGCARHLGMHFVEQLCTIAYEGVIEPNCTLFLDLEPEEGIKRLRVERKAMDRLDLENLQFHREVRQGFLHLADLYPNRIVILDAAAPIDQVVEKSVAAVQPFLHIQPSKAG